MEERRAAGGVLFGEMLEVQEVEVHAIEGGCGRDVVGLLRASICEV